MIIKTIHSSEWEEWHKHFLWKPATVLVGPEDIKEVRGWESATHKYKRCIMWLCTVERKQDDFGKWIYFKSSK